MWNYETVNSAAPTTQPQRFELLRSIPATEDIEKLPLDGEFHGSFSLQYHHITGKGKRKTKIRVVNESGVAIKFTPVEGKTDEYNINATGTNQFGTFEMFGQATKSEVDVAELVYHVKMRKRYTNTEPAPDASSSVSLKKAKKRKLPIELPAPTPKPVGDNVCLRGKLAKTTLDEVTVHKIKGKWAASSKLLDTADSNDFDYEHRGTSQDFPLSGRYTGWFILNSADGKQRVTERDVTLKFHQNNAGEWNVDGKGSNGFGKYTITGTMVGDEIEIYRHYAPVPPRKAVAAPVVRTPALPAVEAAPAALSFDDVTVPKEEVIATMPPASGSYSAISRGTLRVNGDNTHTCAGKWSVSREAYTNGATSNFHFGLEDAGEDIFPLDSTRYKGSFKMRNKSGSVSKYTAVIDRQIVLKFKMNTLGSYNVYGVGINDIGKFQLIGTFVKFGEGSGQVELYRIYPAEMQQQQPAVGSIGELTSETSSLQQPSMHQHPAASLIRPPTTHVPRTESGRAVRLPPHLAESQTPTTQHTLKELIEKCRRVLIEMKEKDLSTGSYFAEPVDPVALGIPTYHTIITSPMDLGTVSTKLDSNEITTVEEFGRLVRLVFTNAIKFNVDEVNHVHVSAKRMLSTFNSKFKEVERTAAAALGKSKKSIESKKIRDEKRRREKEKRTQRDHKSSSSAGKRSRDDDEILDNKKRKNNASQSEFVSRIEFDQLNAQFRKLYEHMKLLHSYIPKLATPMPVLDLIVGSSTSTVDCEDDDVKEPPPKKVKKPQPIEKEIEAAKPLTLKEQEILTETINDISEDKLHGIIAIIRESSTTKFLGDEEEIDLEIDQLDNETQRKLQRFVMKNVKQSRKKPSSKNSNSSNNKVSAAPDASNTEQLSQQLESKNASTVSSPTQGKGPATSSNKSSKKVTKPVKNKKKKKQSPNSSKHPSKNNHSNKPKSSKVTNENDKNSSAGNDKTSSVKTKDSFFNYANSNNDSSDSSSSDEESDESGEEESDQSDDDSENDKVGKSNGDTADTENGKSSESQGGQHQEKKADTTKADAVQSDDSDSEDGCVLPPRANWNVPTPVGGKALTNNADDDNDTDEDDEEDEWGSAREDAKRASALAAEKKKREATLLADAEMQRKKNLEKATEKANEIREKKKEQEAKELQLKKAKEKKEEDERKAARIAHEIDLANMEQTVDMDRDRDIMKQFENGNSNFDDLGGGASPASDFGF